MDRGQGAAAELCENGVRLEVAEQTGRWSAPGRISMRARKKKLSTTKVNRRSSASSFVIFGFLTCNPIEGVRCECSTY
jgi:hypothetical protein